jgi:hypothetical protein
MTITDNSEQQIAVDPTTRLITELQTITGLLERLVMLNRVQAIALAAIVPENERATCYTALEELEEKFPGWGI